MPRQLRIEMAGGMYHVMARGDRREPIFHGDEDRELFLRPWGKRADVVVGAFMPGFSCPNHYHLLLETPRPNLVAGMSWLQNTFTIRFNRRHRLSGHLFGGRYSRAERDSLLEGSPKGVRGGARQRSGDRSAVSRSRV
ncbi:MAG: transposase [Verrucomicrobiales bacterium]